MQVPGIGDLGGYLDVHGSAEPPAQADRHLIEPRSFGGPVGGVDQRHRLAALIQGGVVLEVGGQVDVGPGLLRGVEVGPTGPPQTATV